MINKASYAMAILSYIVGMCLLDKDSIFLYFYFGILPASAIVGVLFNLMVDNAEKLKEGDLFVFFYLLISAFSAIFLFIDSSNLIAIICLIISGSSTMMARKTDKYWARKENDN